MVNNGQHKLRRVAAGLTVALAVVLTPAAALAAPDEDAKYTVSTCRGAGGDTSGWTGSVSGSYNMVGSSCTATGGYLFAYMDGGSSHSTGHQAALKFEAPTDTLILGYSVTGIQANYTYAGVGESYLNYITRPTNSYTSGLVAWQCAYYTGCYGGSTSTWGETFTTTDAIDKVYFVAACGGTTGGVCSSGGTYTNGWWLSTGTETLYDRYDPTVTISGGLVDGSTLKGTETLEVAATDRGSGVKSVILNVDGTDTDLGVIDDNAGTCTDGSDSYISTTPCSLSANNAYDIDTSAWSEGTHEIRVTVSDASGRTTNSSYTTITTDNIPVPTQTSTEEARNKVKGDLAVGDTLTCEYGRFADATDVTVQWLRSGSVIAYATEVTYTVQSADIGKLLTCRVTASNSEGSVVVDIDAGVGQEPKESGDAISPTVQILPTSAVNNGENASRSAVLKGIFSNTQNREMIVKYGKRALVTGTLRDADGNPIKNASLSVTEQVALADEQWAPVTTVTTDNRGEWEYYAAVGPSRTLRVSYKANSSDSESTDTAEVTLGVRASVKLKSSRRVIKGTQVVTFKGSLRGGWCPKGGKLVELRWKDGSKWRIFATAKTGINCKFRAKYRLSGRVKGVIKFRATVRKEAKLYPFETGNSNTLKLRVR